MVKQNNSDVYKVLTGSQWEEVATGTVIKVLIGDDVVAVANKVSASYALGLYYGMSYLVQNLSTGDGSTISRSTLLSSQYKEIHTPHVEEGKV